MLPCSSRGRFRGRTGHCSRLLSRHLRCRGGLLRGSLCLESDCLLVHSIGQRFHLLLELSAGLRRPLHLLILLLESRRRGTNLLLDLLRKGGNLRRRCLQGGRKAAEVQGKLSC